MRAEITPRQFYISGVFLFSVIAIGNIINFYMVYSFLNLPSKITTIAGILFNIVLVLFFNYLLGTEPKETVITQSDDIDQIIKDLENEN